MSVVLTAGLISAATLMREENVVKVVPHKSWDDVIMDYLNSCNLNKESALDRVTWRSIMKSATKTSNRCFKERSR